ncbi:MAG: hypothetical protein IKL65_06365 [Bacilli bacterium]|nr:hypothetical protein [Bacilli bacterium]
MIDNRKIILTWYEIKEGLLSLGKKDSSLKLYKDFVYKNLKDLKRMECYKTRNDIELIVKNRSFSYPYDKDLYNIYLNNIFGMTLGMIDAKINYYNARIEADLRQQSFISGSLKNSKQQLLEYKEVIINDIDQFISNDDSKLKKELKTLSSHATIEDLYEYMRKNKSNFNVAGELLNSYIYGYNKPLISNNEELFLYYKKVISNFRKTKDKNECCIQKVKCMKKKK